MCCCAMAACKYAGGPCTQSALGFRESLRWGLTQSLMITIQICIQGKVASGQQEVSI